MQNIVNTEDFGFGVRVLVDGTWGFASSSAVTKDDIAAIARQAVGIAKANKTVNTDPVKLAPVDAYPDAEWNTPVQKDPFEIPLQPKIDLLLQINEEALKVHGRELRVGIHALREREEVLRLERGLVHHAVADPLLAHFSVTSVDRATNRFYQRNALTAPDGHGLRVHREPAARAGGEAGRRGSGRDAQGEAGGRRARRRSSCTRRTCG